MSEQKWAAVLTAGFLAVFAVSVHCAETAGEPKTYITGSRMTLLRKGQAVEFRGGVHLTRGDDFMSADRMVSEQDESRTHAWGHVYLRRDVPAEKIRWEAWAEEAAYDSKASSGTLWGRKKTVLMKRTSLAPASSTGTVKGPGRLEMNCVWATFYPSTGSALEAATGTFTSARASGKVYVLFDEVPRVSSGPAVSRETRVWSNDCFYDGENRNARFWGGYDLRVERLPRAVQREGEEERDLQGESLIYNMTTQRLKVINNVKAVFLSPQKSSPNNPRRGATPSRKRHGAAR